MGSQQVRQSGERQVDKPLVSLAPATEQHNSTQYQELRADQLLANIDRQLYDVSATVGNARKVLYDYSTVLTTSNTRCSEYERAYHEERQRGIARDARYAGLYNQHQKAINDMHAISCKCYELQQQLESNRGARDANSPMIQEKGQFSEVEVARAAGKGRELSQSDLDMAKPGIENEQLKARIREEDAGERQDYQKALTNAVNHINNITQKVDEVEKMCQPTSAEQIPASVFDNSESSSQPRRGRAKRARETKQAATTE